MIFHILTLFPEMIEQGLNTSIIGRAVEKELIEVHAVNIRDYTEDKHGKVDDYTYGGGAGMLMQAQPVFDAWKAVNGEGRKLRTIYVTPQGHTFDQKMASEFAKEEELIILCGHYEGIDERVLEEVVTDYVSIGDYVLTGGELPAMVMTDAIARLVPGVLNNDVSAETESFHNDLLEYPQYSRPEVWHDKQVPAVLLSGNHTKVMEWRLEESIKRTRERRPDLYEKYKLKEKVIKRLGRKKRLYIHMIENLRRGRGEVLYEDGENVCIWDRECELCMLSASDEENGRKLLKYIPDKARLYVVTREFLLEMLMKERSCSGSCKCYQAMYTQNTPLAVKHKDIRNLSVKHLDYLMAHYSHDEEYLREALERKVIFGAFVDEKLVGFVGAHTEGSIGMLFVDEAFRGRGIGASLESFMINHHRNQGFVPYCNVIVDNEKSAKLQERLGLYVADDFIWWIW